MKVRRPKAVRTSRPCAHCQTNMSIVLGWWACPNNDCHWATSASADELYHKAKEFGHELVFKATEPIVDTRRVAEIKVNLTEIERTLRKMPNDEGRQFSYAVNAMLTAWFDHQQISDNHNAVQSEIYRAQSARKYPSKEPDRWYWRIMLPALKAKLNELNTPQTREVAHAV